MNEYIIQKIADAKKRNPSLSWEQAERLVYGILQLEQDSEIQED